MRGFSIFFLSLLFFLHDFSSFFAAADPSAILLSKKNGLKIKDDGKRWKDFNAGLPQNFLPLTIKIDSRENLYLATMDSGIYKWESAKSTWKPINSDAFLSGLAGDSKYRKVSAFAIDDRNPDILILATKHSLFRSGDGGKAWERMDAKTSGHNYYITALSSNGGAKSLIYGTSFNGTCRISGGRIICDSSGLPREPYTDEMSFYEEVSALSFDEKNPSIIYAGLKFGGGLYISVNAGKKWSRLEGPFDKADMCSINEIVSYKNSLYVSTDSGIYRFDNAEKSWSVLNFENLLSGVPQEIEPLSVYIVDESKKHPPISLNLRSWKNVNNKNTVSTARNRKAIYIGIPGMKQSSGNILKTIKKNNLNSIVVDMKDDFGNIYFPAENHTAREIGAVKSAADIVSILKFFKKENIYTIARVVVFKDGRLYKSYNNRYAIWNGVTNSAWAGNTKEFWVDPYSDFVKDYNIALCRELERFGFDEIQFDYIRFPSDGPTQECLYRYRQNRDIYKSEALLDFLKRAKREIRRTISVDVYGFSAWYRMGNPIGQDIEEFSRVVDVICPMVYPSHFGLKFYRRYKGNEHPYMIVYESGKRALSFIGSDAIVRPYLQAFKLYSPTWGPDYIRAQVDGAVDSGCSGFTLWNAKGDYGMVNMTLKGMQK
jgi:photosystem II stability/assembly factor-like uncharacterized protein